MSGGAHCESEADRAENIEVYQDRGLVELRIDGREDLAMPFRPDHAIQLAMQLQRAAADAKRYSQAETDHSKGDGR